jgi:nitroreductase
MQPTDVTIIIKNRRYIQKYTGDDISEETLDTIFEADRWAPSGLNNQPWSFITIKNKDMRDRFSGMTK